jgi:hypothetical protein
MSIEDYKPRFCSSKAITARFRPGFALMETPGIQYATGFCTPNVDMKYCGLVRGTEMRRQYDGDAAS